MKQTQQWLATIGAAGSPRDIAQYAGVSHATLYRQISQGQLTFDVVLNLARHYGVSPIAALVANGYLTETEAGIDASVASLQTASDDQLINEIARRIKGDDINAFDTQPSAVWAVEPTMDDIDPIPATLDEGVKSAFDLAAQKGERRADQPHAE